jgi:hypothetical protein
MSHYRTYLFALIFLQYLNTWNFKPFYKTHRRCSSFPETQYSVWRNGRNKSAHFRLLKQASEGSQQKVEANASLTNAVLANENTITLDGEHVAVVQNDNFIEDETLCDENASLTKSVTDVSKNKAFRNSQEGSADVVMNITGEFRPWSSLPNLTDLDSANRSRERRATTDVQELPLTSSSAPGRCSQLGHLRTGRQTLPSSPAKFVLNSSEISSCKYFLPESLKCKGIKTQSGNPAAAECSDLSPSVLQIDYSSEVHSDTPPTAAEQRLFVMQKSNKDWSPIPLRSLSKSAITKKQSKAKDDSGAKTNKKCTKSNSTNAENSGSSDTLNPETNKSSDESQPSVLKVVPERDRPCVRPSDLKLSVQSWDETDGSCTETQASSSVAIGKGKQDAVPRKRKTVIVGSAPEYAGEWLSDETVNHGSGHWKLQRKSFIESGGGGVLPMAIGFFPRPTEGQSLTSFLSSGQFSRPSAELDRENAHFSICEAMIAAVEQVSVNALYLWNFKSACLFFVMNLPSFLSPRNCY